MQVVERVGLWRGGFEQADVETAHVDGVVGLVVEFHIAACQVVAVVRVLGTRSGNLADDDVALHGYMGGQQDGLLLLGLAHQLLVERARHGAAVGHGLFAGKGHILLAGDFP